MDKRYQVFVSSTYADLKEERSEVMQALLELDCIPAGMELFPAADDTQWEVIKKVIDDCDYYLLILAGRYGSLSKTGISYTHMEYNYAVEKEIPVVAFLHENIDGLPVSKSEKTDKGKKQLAEFSGIVKERLCKFWNSPKELGSVVSRSVIQLIKNKPATGWVRADKILSSDAASEILRLKDKIEELQNKSDSNPEETKDLQQGEDLFEINYNFRRKVKKKSKEPFDFDFSEGDLYKGKHELTWNVMFKAISPLMINECNEHQIRKRINEELAKSVYKELSEKFEDSSISKIEIKPDSFDTIIIQLRALQLIVRNEKKRRVDDTNTYWTLTKHGDNLMTKMRALKKKK